jgi:hypothetical protein
MTPPTDTPDSSAEGTGHTQDELDLYPYIRQYAEAQRARFKLRLPAKEGVMTRIRSEDMPQKFDEEKARLMPEQPIPDGLFLPRRTRDEYYGKAQAMKEALYISSSDLKKLNDGLGLSLKTGDIWENCQIVEMPEDDKPEFKPKLQSIHVRKEGYKKPLIYASFAYNQGGFSKHMVRYATSEQGEDVSESTLRAWFDEWAIGANAMSTDFLYRDLDYGHPFDEPITSTGSENNHLLRKLYAAREQESVYDAVIRNGRVLACASIIVFREGVFMGRQPERKDKHGK